MQKKIFGGCIIIVGMFIASSMAFATPNASLLYQETDLEGEWWRYDYTFYNTSTNNESLFNVYLDLLVDPDVYGYPLPTGWGGSVWEGWNYGTTYLETISNEPAYDIAAGDSLSGFSPSSAVIS